MLTNPLIADSTVSNEKYALRAKELGHTIISSCEHGYQGRYIECYNLAKQHGLKFLYCAEAYWVKDRTLADDTNSHIILAALNEVGRRDITRILSEANKSGFYRRPRVDLELLLSLAPQNVVITTACIAFWKYEDIEQIIIKLQQHFGDHFYLEVQCHNTPSQQNLNRRIQILHQKYHIPLIFGCDSHYIYANDAQERTDFLYSKDIQYPDEEGWYLDYPDGDTVYQRFIEQGVLSHKEIVEALNNTNIFLQTEEYNCPIFDQTLKLPSLYPDWTQEQKDAEYQRLIWQEWDVYKHEVDTKDWDKYVKEIQYEIDIVVECHIADYFILNYYIIRRGKELGGVLTSTGRGSAVSFITNKLLGFTEVDRIAAHVQMYPERFMSATRILLSNGIPDIDFNVANVAPFMQAQKEIMGSIHAYPMIAHGTMKKSGAWKMFAKANDIDFDTSNSISDQIKRYEKALKYAESDEQDQIQIEDYISSDYLEIYRGSEKYLSLISSWSIAPSAHLLYAGNIEEEIGLIRIKDNLCCLMDGHWAEDNHFLKNDLLKVVVVDIISQVFNEIGIPRLSVPELLKACTPNDPAWGIYEKSCTIGINQVEQPGTSSRVAKFGPRNISELCAFIAAIRPGFKSMYRIFESRQPFSYGIRSFDDLIQTPWMPNSFVLYQEMVMTALNYAGIPMSECYTAIKNISKKRVEKVLALQEKFKVGFSCMLQSNGAQSASDAMHQAEQVWQIIEDSSQYLFNASHAYCVALDSLYGAWLKAHYPTQFYGVYIRIHTAAGNKQKVSAAQAEAESYFKIKFPPFRYGQDNSMVSIDPSNHAIYKSLASIKNTPKVLGGLIKQTYDHPYHFFTDLLIDLRHLGVTNTSTRMLTKIDYFEQFGNNRQLLVLIDACELFKYGDAKTMRLSKVMESPYKEFILKYSTNINAKGVALKTYTLTDVPALLHEIEQYVLNSEMNELDIAVKIENQLEILGYVSTITRLERDRKFLVVLKIQSLKKHGDKFPWGYAIETQSIGSGKHGRMTIRAEAFNQTPIEQHNVIYADDIFRNKKGYWYLNKYTKIRG